MKKVSKHYCQMCGGSIPRMEQKSNVFDESFVIIQQNTIVDRNGFGGKPFYTASAKRKVSYTVCGKCAEKVAEELSRMITKPKTIEI